MQDKREMNDIIRKILSIDQNARMLVLNSEQDIGIREMDLKNRLEQLREDVMGKAKKESQAQYEEAVRKAEADARDILRENDEQIKQLKEHFISIQDRLVSEIFRMVILSEEGIPDQ